MKFQKKSSKPKGIILESSLQSFFFDQLMEANNKSLTPVSQETLFYSSDVLNKFSESSNYFEVVEGRVREKILGVKLLEAGKLTKEERKRTLKDVGDTALCLCGFFSSSLEKKIIDFSYYKEIGKSAYVKLNNLIPEFLDIPYFYKHLSSSFEGVTTLISKISLHYKEEVEILKKYDQWLETNDENLEQELKYHGVLVSKQKKKA